MASVPLSGSEREVPAGARALRDADPQERLEVSVLLRPRAPAQLRTRLNALHASARRTLVLSGTVAQFNAAFGVQLQYFEHAQGSFRGRSGALHVPEQLSELIRAVVGLDNRPQARAHFRILRQAAAQSFTPPQVASLYDFPNATGAGQCIALIELGGGFAPADLQSYFASLGIAAPKVAAVSVDHARNAPGGGSDGPDGEVMLDIEVVGAIAPDDGVSDGAAHVDFPASSPHALACGGTRLTGSGADAMASEVVWNDGAQGGASGGGASQRFALPAWQQGLSLAREGQLVALAMRGVPDVAGNADPQTGYQVRVDGTNLVIGGTSAVAPLWAALLARISQSSGRAAGFCNPQLYGSPKALRDITEGNNGDYEATAGWDGCTGLGSPNGAKLASL
jgi:kumamolisin